MTILFRSLTDRAYRFLAGEHPGEGSRNFLRNLSWIGASFFLAKVASSLLSITAGRLLGPAEYGKVNLFVSAGAAIVPFMIVGLNVSLVRYGVSDGDRERVFGTASSLFTAMAILTGAAVLLFRTRLSAFLGITPAMLVLSLCYAAAAGAFQLTSAMQQASGHFSTRGLSEITFSAILAAGFFAGLYFFGKSYLAMAYAYIAAFGAIAGFLMAKYVPSRLKLLSAEKFRPLAQYSAYTFGGSLGAFLVLRVQSFIINSFLTPEDVGQYAAYYTATIGAAAYMGYAVATVLFPKASSSSNSRRLWKIVSESWIRLALPAVLFFLAAETAALLLMGRHQYGMQAGLMVLFAICGTLMLIYGSLAQIVFSGGAKAARLILFTSWGGGLINFAACLALIPVFKVAGAAMAFILTYLFLLVWLWKAKDPYLSGA